MKGLTNATSQDVAWCPKHKTAKLVLLVRRHCLKRRRPGSQKTWVFISLHRLQIRYSKILLILARPLPIGYFTFDYFSFFLIFNRMDAWSLMRGDAFIHFVCGSRRVNIRLGVLLLIPKSPHNTGWWIKKTVLYHDGTWFQLGVIPKTKLQKFTLVSIKVYHLFEERHLLLGPESISVLHEFLRISGNYIRFGVTDLSNFFEKDILSSFSKIK